MDLTKLGLILLILVTLTTTWARTISQHRQEQTIDEDTEDRDISTKRYSNVKYGETTKVASNGEENNEAIEENDVARYAKIEAENFALKNVRMADNGRRRRTRRRRRRIRSLRDNEDKIGGPISARRFQKMLDKAILKIITGDLTAADMLLLKNFNYSLEEVLSIRERELARNINFPEKSGDVASKIFYDQQINNDLIDADESLAKTLRANRLESYDGRASRKEANSVTTMSTSGSLSQTKKRIDGDIDFDAYNRQAIYDYENVANKISRQKDLAGVTSSLDYDNRSSDNDAIAETDDDIRTSFNRAMEPHVVFKIRYDDSEFDSSSSERLRQLSRERDDRVVTKTHRGNNDNDGESKNTTDSLAPGWNETSSSSRINVTSANDANKTFHSSTIDVLSSLPVVHRLDNFVTSRDELNASKSHVEQMITNASDTAIDNNENSTFDFTETTVIFRTFDTPTTTSEMPEVKNFVAENSIKNETFEESRRGSIYEGLEWVEDDVYRVIPEAVDSPNYYDGSVNEMENETFEDSRINGTLSFEIERRNDSVDEADNGNDTIGYQNESPDDEVRTQTEDGYSSMRNLPNVNLSTYQQLALAHRRDGNVTSPFDSQGQKAIEDIKLKVLAMTGRFNLSSNGNQVQRERLTMFSPICQTPRNTDAEAWSDPFSMNMNFQLNLTTSDHVVAAKVRIYALPQDNMTVSTGVPVEEEDEEEKKIRISIYFYTKSLKKHRSKKRLIDSVVISLTGQGSHWALDVRQALRFWRQSLRNSHGISNNHGLVIQVEDQDGRSLKPSQYIQQDSCHTSELNEDEKTSESLHSSFKPVLVMFVS